MDHALNILVTAGPTHEPIDAVRYLANRSSGRMGLELARAAHAAGANVTLLLGPTPLKPPEGVHLRRFASAADLSRLLDEYFTDADILIMAAAVADWRPAEAAFTKLERAGDRLTLDLTSTPDLVAALAARKRDDQTVIGFALEQSDRLAERAEAKLRAKGLDAIVANPLDTMGAPAIDATVYTRGGQGHSPGAMPKADFAPWLIDLALTLHKTA